MSNLFETYQSYKSIFEQAEGIGRTTRSTDFDNLANIDLETLLKQHDEQICCLSKGQKAIYSLPEALETDVLAIYKIGPQNELIIASDVTIEQYYHSAEDETESIVVYFCPLSSKNITDQYSLKFEIGDTDRAHTLLKDLPLDWQKKIVRNVLKNVYQKEGNLDEFNEMMRLSEGGEEALRKTNGKDLEKDNNLFSFYREKENFAVLIDEIYDKMYKEAKQKFGEYTVYRMSIDEIYDKKRCILGLLNATANSDFSQTPINLERPDANVIRLHYDKEITMIVGASVYINRYNDSIEICWHKLQIFPFYKTPKRFKTRKFPETIVSQPVYVSSDVVGHSLWEDLTSQEQDIIVRNILKNYPDYIK